jgi:hypothetical protein
VLRGGLALALATAGASVVLLGAGEAQAAVRGKQGIEIEGAMDRRGFFVGAGIGFGGTFFYYDDFVPATRIDLVLGGGVTERFTLGADLHVTPYLARDVGVAFGGDVEARGYMWRGLYLGGGLGLSGVPKRSIEAGSPEKGITVGLGGKVDFGYEFWLNSTAALGVGLTFDARFVPGSRFPRQTALVGVRFAWY